MIIHALILVYCNLQFQYFVGMSPLKLGELHVLLQIHVRDEIVNFCVFYGVYSFVYQINTASAAACLPTLCRLCQKAASVSIVCTKRLAIKIMHMFELIN